MLGMIKAMPLILLVAGGAYAYHTTTISKADGNHCPARSKQCNFKRKYIKMKQH